MDQLTTIRNQLWSLLAFTRIPGNAFSFWIRQTLHWSRGRPSLPQESKADLFDYLPQPEETIALAREAELRSRFDLEPLAQASTAALYRKNLYLLDTLETATKGLSPPSGSDRESTAPSAAPAGGSVKALDVGSQDWHYVFGLERWLRFRDCDRPQGRRVDLTGLELDGYGIYADFHSRRDYAWAYAAQTGNPEARYVIGDFLKSQGRGYDVITIFYPFVTRYQLLLWGLPLRFYSPRHFLTQAAAQNRAGGWLVVFCHSVREHELFLQLGRATEAYRLLREGPVASKLVDFHESVTERRFSIWEKIDL